MKDDSDPRSRLYSPKQVDVEAEPTSYEHMLTNISRTLCVKRRMINIVRSCLSWAVTKPPRPVPHWGDR